MTPLSLLYESGSTMALKEISEDELEEILAKHEKWLRKESGGKRADLSNMNLESIDLTGANLTGTILSGALLTSPVSGVGTV